MPCRGVRRPRRFRSKSIRAALSIDYSAKVVRRSRTPASSMRSKRRSRIYRARSGLRIEAPSAIISTAVANPKPPEGGQAPVPPGIPDSYEEHVKMMYDLLVLAYRANATRVTTYMVARETSNRAYPQVGVPDAHHEISHHQNVPEAIKKNVKIQIYHMGLFAQFMQKMRSTPDGDGTLLVNTIVLFGSNMSNSNLHDHF